MERKVEIPKRKDSTYFKQSWFPEMALCCREAMECVSFCHLYEDFFHCAFFFRYYPESQLEISSMHTLVVLLRPHLARDLKLKLSHPR